MGMNFFWFLAVPTPAAKEYDTAGGAYIHCWIRDGGREEAERRAIELIAAEGWEVQALQEANEVTGADYVNDEENREFYEEALVEAEVLVFYTWPGDEDDDVEDGEDDEDEGGEDEDELK
jgi:hypothetical protein